MPGTKCPGMDSAYFKLEDIKERKCLNCGNIMEFWKDDVSLECDCCGFANYNPEIGNTCLAWCKEATACIDSDEIEKWKKKFRS